MTVALLLDLVADLAVAVRRQSEYFDALEADQALLDAENDRLKTEIADHRERYTSRVVAEVRSAVIEVLRAPPSDPSSPPEPPYVGPRRLSWERLGEDDSDS